jgi:hypothetical protein
MAASHCYSWSKVVVRCFVSDSHKMTALFLAMLVSGFAGTDVTVAFKNFNVKFSLQSHIHIYIILLMKVSQFS